MKVFPDLREYLSGWPREQADARLVRTPDRREFLLVRRPMGFEQFEVYGRPDGCRPQDAESALQFQLARLTALRSSNNGNVFNLDAAACAELFDEATMYIERAAYFLRLKEWAHAERDTARNLPLLDLVAHYAEEPEDRTQLEVFRHDMTRLNVFARAMLLPPSRRALALHESFAVRLGVGFCQNSQGDALDVVRLAAALLESMRQALTSQQATGQQAEAVFLRRGEYWRVRFHGEVAYFKTSRGLDSLAILLREPGREFHVRELLARVIKAPACPLRHGGWPVASFRDAGPVLDLQAKAQYKRRLDDLREELEEADRFADCDRVTRAREEINAIAQHLAQAVGLGGRNRRASSEAERARSAFTKRIREAIRRIEEALPPLGRHLSARIKTGYFCSYNPHPDRSVAWKF
jgi:hypothetical protein